MLTQEQKDLLEQAYQQNEALPILILKAALALGDADTVLYIVTEMAERYDEEVQAQLATVKEAVENVVAKYGASEVVPEGATVH